MHYIQYEELCRLFIADKFDLSIEEVKSVRIPSPTHPDLVNYENQIDLYWESGNEVAQYLNIADAKWRGSDNVSKMMAQNLQFVMNDISNINKAILMTNTNFDDGVIGIADKYGMGLYVVRPDFDLAILDPGLTDRKIIQTQLQELAANDKPIYDYKIERRAFDFGADSTMHTSVPDKTDIHTKEMKQAPENRMAQTTSNRGTPPSIQKVQTRDGGSRSGRQSTSKSGRQGGPPSGRQGGSSGPPKGSGSTRGGGGSSNRGK